MLNDKKQPSKILLPLSNESPITYDLRLAVPLMAALSYEEIKSDVWNWIFANYTQLVCKKQVKKQIPYNYLHIYDPYNPFVNRDFELYVNFFNKKCTEIVFEQIINRVSNGFYAYVKIDRFFAKGFKGYLEQHIMHTECIYGYDLEREELYLIGFSKFTDESLNKMVISFEDFKKALESFLEHRKIFTLTFDKVNTSFKYSVSNEELFCGLSDFVNSNLNFSYIVESNYKKQSMFSWDFPINCYYGKSALSYLGYKMSCDSMFEKNARIKTFLQAILEFNKIMLKRMEFFSQKGFQIGDLLLDYEKIVKSCESIKMMFIKYELTDDQKYFHRIIEKIALINDKSVNLIRKFLNRRIKFSFYERKKTKYTFFYLICLPIREFKSFIKALRFL